MKRSTKELLFERMHSIGGMPLKEEDVIRDNTIPLDKRMVDVMNFDNPEWQPLYNFLEPIFGERYKEVANGFMFMGARKLFNKKILYNYKNGISRKSINLDKNGESWLIKYDRTNNNFYPEEIKIESHQEAFKSLFDGYENYFRNMGFDDIYNIKYSDYAKKRDNIIKKSGYKTITKNPNEAR